MVPAGHSVFVVAGNSMLRAVQIFNRLVIPARVDSSNRMMSLLCNDFNLVRSRFELHIAYLVLSFYVRFSLQPRSPETARRRMDTSRITFVTRMTSAKMR